MSDEAKWGMRNVELHLGPVPRQDLGPIVDAVVASYRGAEIDGEDAATFPSRRELTQILAEVLELLLPGCPGDLEVVGGDLLEKEVHRRVSWLFELLSRQIALSVRQGCMKAGQPCLDCDTLG